MGKLSLPLDSIYNQEIGVNRRRPITVGKDSSALSSKIWQPAVEAQVISRELMKATVDTA